MRELYGLVGTPRIFAGNLGIIVMQDRTPRGMDQLNFSMVKECGYEIRTWSRWGLQTAMMANNTVLRYVLFGKNWTERVRSSPGRGDKMIRWDQ